MLLARDQEGYRNLVRLTSIGYLEGFYHRPRGIDDLVDFVVARIATLVEEASRTKAKTQLFVEKVEQRYSVGMVAATLAVFAVLGPTQVRLKWNLWGNDGGRTAFALMPFVTPGPAVSAHTPGSRVTFAQPSAANAADASWRTSTMSMPSSRQPS